MTTPESRMLLAAFRRGGKLADYTPVTGSPVTGIYVSVSRDSVGDDFGAHGINGVSAWSLEVQTADVAIAPVKGDQFALADGRTFTVLKLAVPAEGQAHDLIWMVPVGDPVS